jgi:hypothetical protein
MLEKHQRRVLLGVSLTRTRTARKRRTEEADEHQYSVEEGRITYAGIGWTNDEPEASIGRFIESIRR